MCGVAALLGSARTDLRDIGKMCDIIRHRGPDDAGYALFGGQELSPDTFGGKDTPAAVYGAQARYAPNRELDDFRIHEANVALGHRRLSIIDLSPLGHQPMCSKDDRFWISYNGEVYNHIELRTELESRGHRLASRTDTEVVLAAYAEWGPGCLSRFNGMWGLAILDRQQRTLFLARDRFGVKPLYYWISPRGILAVASEIKQFTPLPGWQSRLNGQRAYDFLAWGSTDHSDETLFERVYQLPPGGSALLNLDTWFGTVGSDGRIPTNRWYEPQILPFVGDFDSAVSEYRRLFESAVRLRLRADVPVGFALSGGLDSSSVVCTASALMREHGQDFVPATFSMCADGETFNERKWVDCVVEHVGARPMHVSPTGKDLYEAFPAMAWHLDEPFGSPAAFGQWSVFRSAAASAIKVLLGGHGSDEALAGYPPFHTPLLGALARKGKFFAVFQEARALLRQQDYGLSYVPRLLIHACAPFFLLNSINALRHSRDADPGWIDLQVLRATPENPLIGDHLRGNRSMRDLSTNFLMRSPSPMVLRFEDRSSMAHSFEARAPFMDYRLVEFSIGLPDEFKLRLAENKRILRAAMAEILPTATVRRSDKIGMGTPNEKWVLRESPAAFGVHLKDALEAAQGVLTPDCLKFSEAVISGKKPFSQAIWRMLSFGAWMKRFGVQA